MAIEDVLDDGEAEAGAAARPAFLHIDAVKSLGEPRNVVIGDARPMILHGEFVEALFGTACRFR